MNEQYIKCIGCIVTTLFAGIFVAASETPGDENIEGIWKIEWVQTNGEPKSRERSLWMFGRTELTVATDRGENSVERRVDSDSDPKRLSTGFRFKSTGIYAMDGDRLQVAFAFPGTPAPSDFKSRQGDMKTVIAFSRIADDFKLPDESLQTLLTRVFGALGSKPVYQKFDREAGNYIGNLMASIPRRQQYKGSELKIIRVSSLVTQIDDGGLHQFFQNSGVTETLETIRILREIGATETASILARARAAFAGSGPSDDEDKRLSEIADFSIEQSEFLNNLDDEFATRKEDLYLLLTEQIGDCE